MRASAALLAIEVLSPGSYRTDRVFKRSDYADAGLVHYWIIDPEPPVSLVAHTSAGELGYRAQASTTGVFEAELPFPLRIDLDALS